jgi:hypothetical protein
VARVQKIEKAKKNQTNLAQFFLESPLRDSELDLMRDRPPVGHAPIDQSFGEPQSGNPR